MTWSYNGHDLNDGVVLKTGFASEPFNPAPAQHTLTPYATRPGGVVTLLPPGTRTVSLAGFILGDLISGTWEANRDTLLSWLSAPGQRLVASFAAGRYVSATPTNIQIHASGPRHGEWSADFLCHDAYTSSTTPSGNERTPTLAAIVGLTSGGNPAYGESTLIVPGGTAPAPVRLLLTNQAGGIQPTRWLVRNRSFDPPLAFTTTAGIGASEALLLEEDGRAYIIDLASVVGWFPLEMNSGNALDMSADSRDGVANGALIYHADSEDGSAIDFDGSTGYFDFASATYGLTGSFSFGATVWADVAGTAMGIAGKGSATAGWFLHRTAADVFEAKVSDGATVITATGTRTVVVGQRYRVWVTFDAATRVLSVYVNGRMEIATAAGAAYVPAAGTNNFRIGAPQNPSGGAAEFWNGRIGGWPVVLDVALTADQVRTDYRQGFGPILGTALGDVPSALVFDPGAGAANEFELICFHATTAATLRMAYAHRARFL